MTENFFYVSLQKLFMFYALFCLMKQATPPNNTPQRMRGWIGAILSMLYVLSPFDLVPDAVPIAGLLEDVLIGMAGILNLIESYGGNFNGLLARTIKIAKWIILMAAVLIMLVGLLLGVLVYHAFS